MRILYSLFLYLVLPFYLLRLVWRGFKSPAYWQRISERFGFCSTTFTSRPVWVHAVSVGEVRAAIPLVKWLKKNHPDIPVVITTTTPTGAAQVKKIFTEGVRHCYMPFDLPGAVARFITLVQPRLGIIMETEIWPNLFHACHVRSIPVVMANARMSQKSCNGYKKFASLVHEVMQTVTFITAQNESDAVRLIELGANPDRLKVIGSVKFDITIPASLHEQATQLREQLGHDRHIMIAASTHEGEEEQILNAFNLVRQTISDCLLIIVPRHPERFSRVALLCKQYGFNVAQRTDKNPCSKNTEIFIGDTMGELLLFYAVSDIAFIGGSLIEHGGQNPLEAAALGLPVMFGPHTFNFNEVTEMLTQAGAASRIENEQQLAQAAIKYLTDESLRKAAGEKGKQVIEQNRGALERLIEIVSGLLQ